MDVNWSQLVFSEQFYEGLKHKVSKRIINAEDAEEGVLYVIEKLAENDWARCKKFKGDSKPETFLFSVVHRLIGDFHRKTYGRQRPPEWLKRKGELWIKIWNELCLKRQLPKALVNQLCHDGTHEVGVVEAAIVTIKGKLPWCGYSNPPSPEDFPESADPSPGPGDLIDDATFEVLTEMCALILKGENPHGVIAKIRSIGPNGLNEAIEKLVLTQEELLFLKMHFDDGLSFAEIARIHNAKPHSVRQKVTTVLTNMRQALESIGVDSDTVESTLG